MQRILILMDARGRRHAVQPHAPMVTVRGLGTLDTANLVAHLGRRIEIGGKSFLVLEPSARDLRETMNRGPQTLAAKDLALLLHEAGVLPGACVVEAGAGSGWLTVALARAVGSSGRIISYDLREEALRLAATNVEAAGVTSVVELRSADARKGFEERDVDAVILDILDPWSVVDAAWEALKPCGHFASFSPNMEQVKETVAALRHRPFVDVRTIEVIERELEVRDVGVRPSFAALGHTGYLTFARKVLDTF